MYCGWWGADITVRSPLFLSPAIYTVTSKGQLHFLTSSQGQKVTYLGHVAYYLMRLDKRNILKPTPGLYLIPIKSY